MNAIKYSITLKGVKTIKDIERNIENDWAKTNNETIGAVN